MDKSFENVRTMHKLKDIKIVTLYIKPGTTIGKAKKPHPTITQKSIIISS